MNSSQIDKVISLIRRTGDKFVVLDKKSDDVFVMMDVADYEHMLLDPVIDDLSEEEMLARVDRDIAHWRATHDDEGNYDSEKEMEVYDKKVQDFLESEQKEDLPNGFEMEEDDFDFEDDDFDSFENDIIEDFGKEKEIDDFKDIEKAEKEEVTYNNLGEEQEIENIDEDDEDEDKFYLEPVE